jgi:hypothetical protein
MKEIIIISHTSSSTPLMKDSFMRFFSSCDVALIISPFVVWEREVDRLHKIQYEVIKLCL